MGLSFETLDKLFFNTVTIINEVMFMKCHKYINECGNTQKNLFDKRAKFSCLGTSKAQNKILPNCS